MSSTTGLRERKRHETRARLESATIDLVARDGLDKVTVEMISEAANVSTRTFFNYFESKEDALLGFYNCEHADNANVHQENTPNDTDLIKIVVGILVDSLSPSIIDPTLNKNRIKLLRQYPQLLDKQIEHITNKKGMLTDLVKKYILDNKLLGDDNSANLQAEVIIMACVGGVRAAAKEWSQAKQKDILPAKIKQRAIELIKESIRTIKC